MDAGLGGFGQGNIESNGGRFLLSSEVGFGSLFGKRWELGAVRTDEIQSGGAADFIEGLAEELFFAVDGVFLEESEKFALFGTACSNLGEGGHGVAADFF